MAKSFPNTGATVIDSAADLPAASAALEGILMFQKDTNELKICDGAGWVSVLDTDQPPGFAYIGSFSGSGTNISVNNVFSSAYVNYRIILRNTAGPSVDTDITMRMRAGGVDATTNYQTMGAYIQDNGVAANYTASNQSYWFMGATDAPTGGPYYASAIDIFSPFENTQTFASGLVSSVSGTGYSSGLWLNWNHSVVRSNDGFTLWTSNGATISMSGRVYGYR